MPADADKPSRHPDDLRSRRGRRIIQQDEAMGLGTVAPYGRSRLLDNCRSRDLSCLSSIFSMSEASDICAERNALIFSGGTYQ
jgi:hypothetical protein